MLRSMMLMMLSSFAFANWGYGGEPAAGKQVEQSFMTKDGTSVPYLLYLPTDYHADTGNLPLMLFLHGRGESDGPLSIVAKWGPPLLVTRGESLPFILVSPQCPKEDNWSSPTQQERLSQLLAGMIEKYRADERRIYLTGLSMGGSGSWRMAADHPSRFAAVVPICGRGNVADAKSLASVPIWVFCGDQDGVYQANSELVDAVRQAGSKTIRFTSLEHVGHNSWSAAFASPDLYSWLAAQSK